MIRKTFLKCFQPLPLALAVTAGSVQSYELSRGDLSMQLGTSVTYGIAARTENPDRSTVAKYGTEDLVPNASGSTYNFDDGNLNFKKGDVYTNVLKATADLEVNYKDFGGFFRGKVFYDAAIMDQNPEWKEFNDETKDAAGSGYDLLDAFVWYNFDIGNTPVSARLGRQVISWGESTFIQGGINSINPIDASAARKPGVEVKEILLPVNLAYTSIGLTDDLTLEAFYQIEWEKTRIDPCGTFFSTVDFVADGCGPVILGGDDGEIGAFSLLDGDLALGVPLGIRNAPITERMDDDEPNDDGQYGLALRWYSEALGDTEFGFYHMNIHSRVPLLSGKVGNPLRDASGNGIKDTLTNPSNPGSRRASYFVTYPEDIQLSGISFSRTTDSGWSLGGEISLTQDRPLQHNSLELLLAGNLSTASRLFKQRADEALGGDIDITDDAQVLAARQQLAGETVDGFDLYDIVQAQMTFIKFFDQVLGASRLTVAAEVGMTHVVDLKSKDEARYGRSGAFGLGTSLDSSVSTGDICSSPFEADGTTVNLAKNETISNCTNDGYVDETSGGIRVRGSLDYPNAFLGVNMKPTFAFGYDMNNGPEPGSQFIDERVQLGLGLNFEYLNTYSGGIAYNMFDGGRYNAAKDRDNVSLNLKVTF